MYCQWSGESKHANIGISLPGTNESPSAPVYVDGEKVTTLRGDSIKEDFLNIIETYIAKTMRGLVRFNCNYWPVGVRDPLTP